MAIAYDINFDMLRILEISCVNGTHQISVRGVSADLRVVKYANTTLSGALNVSLIEEPNR